MSDLVLDPMFADLLTPESAERLVAYRPPASVGRRLEALAEKAGEGELTPDERREYAGLIHALDLVTLFQLKGAPPAGVGELVSALVVA